MSTIELEWSGGHIKIGLELIKSVGNIISSPLQPEKIHIVTDKNVADYHLESLQRSLSQANLLSTVHVIEPGEQSKSFATLEWLLEEILSCNPTRRSAVIAFGGGVVGDVAGLVANMLLRGVNLIHIPTTFLSQVDSSIGGKCAINSTHGKNLIGTICVPKLILTDVNLLKTLPQKELISGYAEVVKYAMLYDAGLFTWIQENIGQILEKDLSALLRVVKRCCQIKLGVVQGDQLGTKGSRVMLNFGHTIAHAIEAASKYSVLHGEAVSIGMVMESTISNIDNSDMKENLQRAGLPISLKEISDDWDIDLLHSYIVRDKKIKNNTLELAALEKVGKSYTEYVSCDFMRSLLHAFLS